MQGVKYPSQGKGGKQERTAQCVLCEQHKNVDEKGFCTLCQEKAVDAFYKACETGQISAEQLELMDKGKWGGTIVEIGEDILAKKKKENNNS